MNDKVVIVADHAAEGLNRLVQKRKNEFEYVREDLGKLKEELLKVQTGNC